METLEVLSPAFKHDEEIPEKYTCDEDDINPPLHIENLPDETQSMVLIVEDANNWDHWIVYNIPYTNLIDENSNPGIEIKNSSGKETYNGPCPKQGEHRYIFKVFALKEELEEIATKDELLEKMKPHIIAKGELAGMYSR